MTALRSIDAVEVIECRDPATGERLGEVPVMGGNEVVAAVERGRRAQPAWAMTTFAERRRVLRSLLDAIVSGQDEICRLAVHESGKTMIDAVIGEVLPVCETIRYTLVHGERDLASERRSPGFLLHKTAELVYEPLGVIGVITTWSSPFHNLLGPVVPALFAGNAVVVKVSELACWSSLVYVELIREALRQHGHDPALLQIVTGYDEAGAALVEAGVDIVFFTGSSRNGRTVMATASRSLTPVVLELGSKDPLIVCDDADLERALDSAMVGVFTACGQVSSSAERLYVFDAVYDEFLRMAEGRVKRLRQGPPLEELVDCGATTTPGQLEIIEDLIDDALGKGARVLVGGRRRDDLPGTYFAPTILVDVDHTMRITQEEVLGPVMVIVRVRDEEEAIRLANDCPFGFGSSVFTRDRARGERIARRLRAGTSVINGHGLAHLIQSLPRGGTMFSGFGRMGGREGLRACCYTKAVVNDRAPFGGSPAGHLVTPVGERTYDLLESAVRVLYSRGLHRKARATWDTLRSLVAMVRDPKRD